jgi:hypothetical protein
MAAARVYHITATGVVKTGSCKLVGVILKSLAQASADLTLHDHATAASGNELPGAAVPQANDMGGWVDNEGGILIDNGIYATLTASTEAWVFTK